MIATAHGRGVCIVGGGPSVGKTALAIAETATSNSVSVMIVSGDDYHEMMVTDLKRVAARLDREIHLVKHEVEYLDEEVKDPYFVPVNTFKRQIVRKSTRYIRKIPIGHDRAVNKRKTFLKSLQ